MSSAVQLGFGHSKVGEIIPARSLCSLCLHQAFLLETTLVDVDCVDGFPVSGIGSTAQPQAVRGLLALLGLRRYPGGIAALPADLIAAVHVCDGLHVPPAEVPDQSISRNRLDRRRQHPASAVDRRLQGHRLRRLVLPGNLLRKGGRTGGHPGGLHTAQYGPDASRLTAPFLRVAV